MTLAELAKDDADKDNADDDSSGQFEFQPADEVSPKHESEPPVETEKVDHGENESVYKFKLRCRLQRGSVILDKLSDAGSLILFFQQVAASYELRSDRQKLLVSTDSWGINQVRLAAQDGLADPLIHKLVEVERIEHADVEVASRRSRAWRFKLEMKSSEDDC